MRFHTSCFKGRRRWSRCELRVDWTWFIFDSEDLSKQKREEGAPGHTWYPASVRTWFWKPKRRRMQKKPTLIDLLLININLTEKKSRKTGDLTQKAICYFFLSFFCKTRRRKTALGTSAYEKSQRNEDILACRSVITGVGRGGWMFLIAPSSALLPVLISSLWHEGGAVAPPV